jgi:hypothetical protein
LGNFNDDDDDVDINKACEGTGGNIEVSSTQGLVYYLLHNMNHNLMVSTKISRLKEEDLLKMVAKSKENK